MSLNVLAVASEAYPLVKTGGLADVVGALPAALAPTGVRVRTLLPGYGGVLHALRDGEIIARFDDLFGGPAAAVAGCAAGLDVIAIDAPHLYARPGGPYSDGNGRDWPDNAFRFAALGWVAAEIGRGATALPAPEIAHLHDWQSGLAAAYMAHADRRPRIVATIHNIAFQGWFPAQLLPRLGLPPQAMSIDGVEYYGGIGFLKAGLFYADRITTVSPSYASEILEPAGGMGLEGLLRSRKRDLFGILNGIDVDVWDPETDPRLEMRYSARDLMGRRLNKRALADRFRLGQANGALTFGVVSRLSDQKGLDLLADAVPALLETGANLAVLGAGDAGLEQRFRALGEAHPGRVGCAFGYDETLAHLIQGGADALLVPSRFEPCGLTQLCALRYGAVPVVARVGGLADTVIDANPVALAAGVATGVQFCPVGRGPLEAAIRRTAALYADQATWTRLQRNGMATDVSWEASARIYAGLYRDLLP